jgi:NAD-dependent SIR2 family protein deacetylase
MSKSLNERSKNIIMLNLETVILKIQDIFKTRVVTIVGSGLSAAHGLPGMRDLAQTLLASDFKLESQNSISQWNDIKKNLSNGVDLESALSISNLEIEVLSHVSNLVGAQVENKEREVIEKVFSGEIYLPFSDLIKHLIHNSTRAPVITTNYDRLIEIAAEAYGYSVDTSFIGEYFGLFSPEKK